MAQQQADWVMPALKDVRERLAKAREIRERRQSTPGDPYVPGHDQEGPPGHSFWDGEEWYPIPDVTPVQVLRALVKDPSPENLENAKWYTENWYV